MKLCPKCQKHFSDDANFCPVDAARLLPLEPGQEGAAASDPLSSRFALGNKLGGGRTGPVLRATDRSDKGGGKAVALKLVSPAVMALPGVAARLERELKQLERVQSGGVAKVIASGKRNDETWIAMELVEGCQTLAEAISARGPIEGERAAELIEVIGEALIEAAQVGVVHRDLAPKNVLFAGDQIKLINFSLPVPTSDKLPGVPEFVAPEQADGKPVDQRSNIYSLGALYYYLLTGQAPAAEPKPPSGLVAVPATVDAVILRALDRSPTKRFLTVRQFLDEVGRVAGGEAFNPRSTMPMGRVGKPRAELVQTLLGVRLSEPAAPSAAVAAPSTPTVTPSAPVVAPSIASAPTAATPALATAPTPEAPVAASPAPASPWAPPAGSPPGPMAPAAAAISAAAPAVGAIAAAPAAPAAPVLAAPVVAAPAAGKKKGKEGGEGGGTKGKFRETMWFKKGELDAAAAQAAAEERAATGKDVATDKADSLPIDDRYKDDGSINASDKEKYSLRTGATQMMTALREGDPQVSQGMHKVSEDDLVNEMKGGRTKYIVMIGVGVVVLAGIIALVAR